MADLYLRETDTLLTRKDLPVNPMQRRERSRWVTWLFCMMKQSRVESLEEVAGLMKRGLRAFREALSGLPNFS